MVVVSKLNYGMIVSEGVPVGKDYIEYDNKKIIIKRVLPKPQPDTNAYVIIRYKVKTDRITINLYTHIDKGSFRREMTYYTTNVAFGLFIGGLSHKYSNKTFMNTAQDDYEQGMNFADEFSAILLANRERILYELNNYNRCMTKRATQPGEVD